MHSIIQYRIQFAFFLGPYGRKTVEDIDEFMKRYVQVQDKNVLIIGSESPWIELIALNNGAKKVTSVDYTIYPCEDTRMNLMTTYEMNEKFLKNELPLYDVVISFSSIEHSGLGRYGDNLNPWGDLIAMAKAWCLTKPDGKALVGFPVSEEDKIVFNSHKLYGPIMLSHIFANWKLEHTNLDLAKVVKNCDYCYQPLFVLRK